MVDAKGIEPVTPTRSTQIGCRIVSDYLAGLNVFLRVALISI